MRLGDIVVDGIDRLVEPLEMSSQLRHRRLGDLRKPRICLRQRQQFIDAANAFGDDQTELGKMPAQCVNSSWCVA